MGVRLSKNQRRVLEMVEAQCHPARANGEDDDRIIPLYVGHLPTYIFDSYSHRERFVKNLEARGLLRYEREMFLYITDKGRQAVTSNVEVTGAARLHRAASVLTAGLGGNEPAWQAMARQRNPV